MHSLKIRSTTLIYLSLFVLIGCSNRNTEEYVNEIENWRQLRVNFLKSEEGFLNLAGLFWLEQPISTLGSDQGNRIVFPSKAPERLGALYLNNDSVWFIQEGSDLVLIDGNEAVDTTLVFVNDEVSKTMHHKDLHWFIIKRGTEYGIRLKDYNHQAIDSLNHIDNYSIDASWKVDAEWEEYDSPSSVLLKNQVGMDIEYEIKGVLKFDLKGESYALEPVATGEEDLFIMFYDKTSGKETYGSGRYIYVKRPENNKTFIDFNKAFNPPCVYTEFATCLFPHKKNRLPISITAGEKYTSTY